MPKNTNGVYQDKSTPGKSNHGVGRGVGYPVNGAGSMGKQQYSPPSPPQVNRGHDGHGNSTYKK